MPLGLAICALLVCDKERCMNRETMSKDSINEY
jgi:hypothetical protein